METTSTPGGREGFSSTSLALSRSMTDSAFSPCRMTTMPPTTSPRPSRSATPRRISGPSVTWATSFTVIGVPFSVRRTRDSRSRVDFTYPRPRTMYSRPEISTSRPPTSLFPLRTAWITASSGMR